VWHIVITNVPWSVCVSWLQNASIAETDELIEVLFRIGTLVDPRNRVLVGGPRSSQGKGQFSGASSGPF